MARWREAQGQVWGRGAWPVPRVGASVPGELGGCHPTQVPMCSPHLGALQSPHCWDFFMEASSPGIVVVQLPSHVRLLATPWTAAHQSSLSSTIFQSLFKLISIESVMPSNHLILCRLLLLPSIFPSFRVFSSSLHQVAKVLELQHQSFQ